MIQSPVTVGLSLLAQNIPNRSGERIDGEKVSEGKRCQGEKVSGTLSRACLDGILPLFSLERKDT
jgi:hypothetical protein